MCSPTLTLLAIAVTGALAPAQTDWQLLDNPGGETTVALRLGASGGHAFFDVPGWESVRGDWVAQTGTVTGVSAREGEAFLRPRGDDAPELAQLVRLAEPSPRVLVAAVWMRTWKGRDGVELRLQLLDSALGELASATTGVRRPTDWTRAAVRLAVPAGTAYARVALLGSRVDGKLCDAYFDDAALEAFGPGHPAELAALDAKELQRRLAAATSAAERRALWRALAFRDARGAKLVGQAFADATDGDDRVYLLELLAFCDDRRSASDALSTALRAGEVQLRDAALDLLGAVSADVAPALGELLARAGDDQPLRRRVLAALLRTGDRAAVRELTALARAGGDDALQVLRAVDGSGIDADLVYRPLLSRYLGDDAEPDLRDAALRALGSLRDPRFLRHLADLARVAASRAQLTAWFRLAAEVGGDAAVRTLLGIVDAGVAHAAESFASVADRFGDAVALAMLRRDGLAHAEPLVRLGAVRALQAHPAPEHLAALRRALVDAEPLVALQAVDAVAALSGTAAGELLEQLAVRGEGRVAAAAHRRLWDRSPQDAVAVDRLLGAAQGHPAFEARAAALDLLPPAGVERGRAVVLAAFGDAAWQVRAAAYGALARVRQRASVAALIARLPDEVGPARQFLLDALVALCGLDQGLDPQIWQRWWDIVGTTFEVPAERVDVERATTGSTISYHGIPVRADRVVFVIDLSGSMGEEIDGETKLQRAKDELVAVLKLLQPSQSFDVIGFGTGITTFEPGLVPATAEHVDAAARWIDALKIVGATNVYDALETALRMTGVESVFLLSDGEPSVGRFVAMDEIRRVIRMLNRDARVRINTILVGGGRAAQQFMRALAAENDGASRTPGEER
ncbi:MAG: VWA domain-containing protein [Planctomycetes bacterium]|nr:VWA domain-containing protein [Planctomycetota bacterium]